MAGIRSENHIKYTSAKKLKTKREYENIHRSSHNVDYQFPIKRYSMSLFVLCKREWKGISINIKKVNNCSLH